MIKALLNGEKAQQREFKLWGRIPHVNWADFFVLFGIIGIIFGLTHFGHQATLATRPAVVIDLSFWMLPLYAFNSLVRGLCAYGLSLVFTLLYGYWAAKDKWAERVLVPLLDILQSIPVLGFMPGFVLAFARLFPHSNVGLEIAAILMIFTGQVWNMTFSFYNSLKSIPKDQLEAAQTYKFDGWQRFLWVELPFSSVGLIWNSMMSMAGGWFFLMINESFRLGSKDFRLPGIGSYMSVAVERANVPAMIAAVAVMSLMIVILDQFLWKPVTTWAQKFRVEETGAVETASSWFLDVLRRSKVLDDILRFAKWLLWRNRKVKRKSFLEETGGARKKAALPSAFLSRVALAGLVSLLFYGAWMLYKLVAGVSFASWQEIFASAALTFFRVMGVVTLASLWIIPVGLLIGLSPRWSSIFQPVIQVAASFPAPMLFPIFVALFVRFHISLNWGSMVLMMLGAQWYILFNVIGGAVAIPSDLLEVAKSYHFSLAQKLWKVYLPGIFPYLVTGWVTAAGGAWNASIVSEYVVFKDRLLVANGLGAHISQAAAGGDFHKLTASVLVMSCAVVLFNQLVWRRMYRLAEGQYSLSK